MRFLSVSFAFLTLLLFLGVSLAGCDSVDCDSSPNDPHCTGGDDEIAIIQTATGCPRVELALNANNDGELTNDDCLTHEGGASIDYWAFEVIDGSILFDATVTSDDFDTMLLLIDRHGTIIAQNDDIEFPINTNSRIEMDALGPGVYAVGVRPYDRTGRGNYRLRIEG